MASLPLHAQQIAEDAARKSVHADVNPITPHGLVLGGQVTRVITSEGLPLTERLRLAVGPITPNMTGAPALVSSGALISFLRQPPGSYFRTLTSGSWDMVPWTFLGSDQHSIIRALADDTVLDSTYSPVTNTFSVQRRSFAGVAVGPQVDTGARPAEGFYVASDGRFVHTFPGEDERIYLRLWRASWQVLGPAFPISIGSTLPLQFRSDAEYTDDGTIWVSWRAVDESGSQRENYLTAITPVVPGDLNADGLLDNFDVDPFVIALVDRPAYEAAFDGLPADGLGDFDGDGRLTNFDIDPFVNALLGSP